MRKEKVFQKERENLLKHITAVEQNDFFKNKENVTDKHYRNNYKLGNKLHVPNFPRTKKYLMTLNHTLTL